MDLPIFSFVLVFLLVKIKMFDSAINPKWIWFWILYSFKRLVEISFYKHKDQNQYKCLTAYASHPRAEVNVTQSK